MQRGHTFKCAQLKHGQECPELAFGHNGRQCCPGVTVIWNARRITHFLRTHFILVVCSRRSGSFYSSHNQSMTGGTSTSDDRTRTVIAKVRFSCVLLMNTDILMHAVDEELEPCKC